MSSLRQCAVNLTGSIPPKRSRSHENIAVLLTALCSLIFCKDYTSITNSMLNYSVLTIK